MIFTDFSKNHTKKSIFFQTPKTDSRHKRIYAQKIRKDFFFKDAEEHTVGIAIEKIHKTILIFSFSILNNNLLFLLNIFNSDRPRVFLWDTNGMADEISFFFCFKGKDRRKRKVPRYFDFNFSVFRLHSKRCEHVSSSLARSIVSSALSLYYRCTE